MQIAPIGLDLFRSENTALWMRARENACVSDKIASEIHRTTWGLTRMWDVWITFGAKLVTIERNSKHIISNVLSGACQMTDKRIQ